MSEAGSFPSLVIRAEGLHPRGTFAEAQAAFLHPDAETTRELADKLAKSNVGVVAHYYMDPELQGVLSRISDSDAGCSWPHIQISDSLLMADAGVRMAEAGVERVIVLGVDFMSENVRAMLDAAGHQDTEVYRVASDPIGCSLAEAAEAQAYGAYLTQAAKTPRSLHVIYINTSLATKARSHHLVPTITCTSSNVVKTVLQAFAQAPDCHVWFGPDTYMGENLTQMFRDLGAMSDETIADLHPAHNQRSIAALIERFHHFRQGVCVVHHMFGREVVEVVRRDYADAFVTAHLEVPGEMFGIALEAQQQGRGVVGSTSNILGFINSKVEQQLSEAGGGRLKFVLATEAGMITSIVRKVQGMLRGAGANNLEAEIIFPVAAEAVAQTDDPDLSLVPGVSGGEGCTTAGGCATCPYMKMNSLDALMDLLDRLGRGEGQGDTLAPFFPKKYVETLGGRTTADLGGEPILHMRHFQQHGELPAALVQDIEMRTRASSG